VVWTSGGGSPICARHDDQLRDDMNQCLVGGRGWLAVTAQVPMAIGQLMGKVRGQYGPVEKSKVQRQQ